MAPPKTAEDRLAAVIIVTMFVTPIVVFFCVLAVRLALAVG